MKCELCGTEVKVVGDETKHYEPVKLLGQQIDFTPEERAQIRQQRKKEYPVRPALEPLDAGAVDFVMKKIRQYWSFDKAQQHTHSWHSREDCLNWLSNELLRFGVPKVVWPEEAVCDRDGGPPHTSYCSSCREGRAANNMRSACIAAYERARKGEA